MFKIRIHSAVDVITNSSTVIYTYMDGCVQPVKDLINEMGRTLGFTETAEDMFYIGVFCDNDRYADVLDNMSEDDELPEGFENFQDMDWKESAALIEEKLSDALRGKCDLPDWMEKASKDDGWGEPTSSTTLYLKAKDPKYKKIGDLIIKLINSTEEEATRDG